MEISEGKDTSPSFFATDKVEPHGYFPTYLQIASQIGPAGKVLELGVEYGGSLSMWQALFPIGEVTGVDCDPDAVFPDGVRKVIASQDDPELATLGPFDLIVDDASHDGKLTRKTFEILWPCVLPGGYYVVEDWFIGIEKYIDGAYDPSMLQAVASFLMRLTKRGDCEFALYRYGMAILRKRGRE